MRGCMGGKVFYQNSTRLRGCSVCKAVEVDLLCCLECGGLMKVVLFIELF